MPLHSSSSSYRPHIDGLRAIAVMLVILFHAFPNRIAGGFIGVDIFFVISGYLISGIILKEIETGKFTIIGFYKKRINRIFPALLIVLLLCLAFSKVLMFKTEAAEFNLSVFFSTTFLANIFFLNTLDYFDNTAEDHPLLHFWSLGVEEQFYIFWPLLLLFVTQKKNVTALRIIIILLAVSFLLNISLISKYPSHVFYSPMTRLWELGFGSFCAYHASLVERNKLKESFSFIYRNEFLVAMGLLLILYCELIVTTTSEFPGWYAVLPVVGSGLILLYGDKSKLAGVILANPILVFIGLISYPLYLWHWPLLSFSHIYLGYLVTSYFKLTLIFASVLLAILTYYLIEVPVRFNIKHSLKPWVLLACLFIIGAYSLLNYQYIVKSGLTESDNFVNSYKHYVANTEFVKKNRVDCGYINTNGTLRETLPADCINQAPISVLLWGDSHAYQFYYGLNKNFSDQYHLSQVASSGCRPFVPGQLTSTQNSNCSLANKRALEIIRNTKPDIVLLAQKDGHEETDWNAIAVKLKQIGVDRVVLLGPVPQWNEYLYRYLAKKYGTSNEFPQYLNGGLLNKQIFNTDLALKELYVTSNIDYISLISMLCKGNGECLTYIQNDNEQKELTTFDYGHLTLSASNHLGGKIAKMISSFNN